MGDIPRWLAVAQSRYPGRPVEQAVPWVEQCIASPNRLALVGDRACGIAEIGLYYGFERRSRLSFLFSSPGAGMEPLRILRQMVVWAKENGAVGHFVVDADTGVDFGPFARRLGGVTVNEARYRIPL